MDRQANRHIKSILGANIKAARDERGWSQARLAVEVGLDWDSTSISRWENGRVRINDENLVQVAKATGKDIAWFYVDREPEEAAA